MVRAAFTHYCLGKPVDRYYWGRNYVIILENCGSEFCWPNKFGEDMDNLPILDLSDVIATPYKGMP